MKVERIGGYSNSAGCTAANQYASESFSIVTEDGRQAQVDVISTDAPRWSGAELSEDEQEEAMDLLRPLCLIVD